MEQQSDTGEVLRSLGNAWCIMATTAAINAGVMSLLNGNEAVTIERIASERHLSTKKLKYWFSFAEDFGIVSHMDSGYVLTSKGLLFSQHSQTKELLGMINLTDYFMRAVVEAKTTFQDGQSLDRLSEGKIVRDYQPRVSDHLSSMLIDHITKAGVKPGDTLLDVGAGNGSFLRALAKRLPGVSLTGVDSNLFAVEVAKKENRRLELTHQIKMLVGDIETDLGDFADDSYDWTIAIHIMHWIPPERRGPLVDHLVRIARKGVFFTEALVGTSPVMQPGEILTSLLYNDFSGFFKKGEAEELNRDLENRYPKYSIRNESVVQNAAYLVELHKSG